MAWRKEGGPIGKLKLAHGACFRVILTAHELHAPHALLLWTYLVIQGQGLVVAMCRPIPQGTASCPIRRCWQWQCGTVVETVCSSLWLSYSAPLSDSRSVRIILISNTLLHGGRPSEKGFSLGSTSHPLLSPSSPRAPHHCRPCCSAPPQNRKFTCPTPTSTWPWTSSPGVI